MATLTVSLLTPESTVWTGEARGLIVRSREGFFTVLAQHADTVTDLVPGLVRIDGPDGVVGFAVHGGFVQVAPGEDATAATVLAGVAERVSEIDVARASAAQEAALAVLASSADDEYATAEATGALARAELRLELAASAG
jgi:F-type H+-transporting ATPase subunit epsilon